MSVMHSLNLIIILAALIVQALRSLMLRFGSPEKEAVPVIRYCTFKDRFDSLDVRNI